jgi:hypothetical protein
VALAACGGDDDKKDGPPKPRQIDRARASGERPVAKAAGSVRHPKAVAIRVSAAPKQRVTVVWALSCSGDDGEQTSGGTYAVKPPHIRPLELPSGASGKVCAVDATAKILTGRVKATLLATAP